MPSFLKHLLFLICFLLLFSCSTKTGENTESSATSDSTAVALELEDIGVMGDFDGDGAAENILIRVLNDSNFHPEEPFSYSVEFSNPRLSPLEISPMIGDGYIVLNEGNVDGKPGEDLSIAVCGMNNTAILSLYGFNDNKWNQIAESVDVGCTLPDSVDWKDVLVDTDSGLFALELNLLNDDAVTYKAKEVILSSATGDFDGNGEPENVYIKTIHDATLDDSGYWEYSIIFSDTKFPPLVIENHEAGGCRVTNNLNTDGKPGDELSVFTSGMMNKVIQEVYGFNGKRWEQLSKEVNTNSSN